MKCPFCNGDIRSFELDGEIECTSMHCDFRVSKEKFDSLVKALYRGVETKYAYLRSSEDEEAMSFINNYGREKVALTF